MSACLSAVGTDALNVTRAPVPNRSEARTQWLAIACARATVHRSLRIAAVVGSILVTINYGDRMLAGTIGRLEIIKISLTYCVPYCVATYAAVSALLGRKQ